MDLYEYRDNYYKLYALAISQTKALVVMVDSYDYVSMKLPKVGDTIDFEEGNKDNNFIKLSDKYFLNVVNDRDRKSSSHYKYYYYICDTNGYYNYPYLKVGFNSGEKQIVCATSRTSGFVVSENGQGKIIKDEDFENMSKWEYMPADTFLAIELKK